MRLLEEEVKLEVVNPEVVRKALLDHGFRFIKNCVEVDTYFAHPCRDFVLSDEALRLRRRICEDEVSYVLTYKGPRRRGELGVKAREEVELYLTRENLEALSRILTKLGFTNIASFSKKRELYSADGVLAYLDYLYGVGYFLELEIKSNEGKQVINRILGILLKSSRIMEETYLEICLRTGKCLVDTERSL